MVKVHQQSFPKAHRIELPLPDEVEPEPIGDRLEREAGIPELLEQLGGGDTPPVAPEPEPVDRYALMREHRKRARQGIPVFKIGDRIRAAREADQEAEAAAAVEADHRREAQRVEQKRLDQIWTRLEQARVTVAEQLPVEVKTEKQRRAAERAKEQAELDADWAKLQANDPMTTIGALEQAFADNEAPAAPLNCEGNRTTVVMQFAQPETIVPERKPALTPGGKRTLKKRTKTESNSLYLEALASNVLATVKEAFAVAPGTEVVQILVIRREIDKKHAGELVAIYVGEFPRLHYESGGASDNPSALMISAPEALLNLKGRTEQVAPIDLSDRPDLQQVLEQVESGLNE